MRASEIIRMGDRLKKMRLEKTAMNQTEFANKCQINVVQYRRYENNKAIPRKEQLQKIADALKVDISELYDNPMKQTAREVACDHITQTVDTINAAINRRIESYSPDEEREYLLSNYDSVNDEGKQKIVEYSEDIAINEKYKK